MDNKKKKEYDGAYDQALRLSAEAMKKEILWRKAILCDSPTEQLAYSQYSNAVKAADAAALRAARILADSNK